MAAPAHPRGMRPLRLLGLFATLATFPLAHAHVDGTMGAPKAYCEDLAQDATTHDYGSGSPAGGQTWAGLFLGAVDGSVGPCASGVQDGHREYAPEGAILLADSVGSLPCYGIAADHPANPTISVVEPVMGIAYYWVGVDIGPGPCGDFQDDDFRSCLNTLSPGVDGAYHVYVTEGGPGHVFTL